MSVTRRENRGRKKKERVQEWEKEKSKKKAAKNGVDVCVERRGWVSKKERTR